MDKLDSNKDTAKPKSWHGWTLCWHNPYHLVPLFIILNSLALVTLTENFVLASSVGIMLFILFWFFKRNVISVAIMCAVLVITLGILYLLH